MGVPESKGSVSVFYNLLPSVFVPLDTGNEGSGNEIACLNVSCFVTEPTDLP